MKPSPSELEADGWAFALDAYARPGIADGCLSLQNEAGVDVMMLLVIAFAAARLRIEHGAITMPIVLNEPLEIEAPILSTWCTTLASAETSATPISSSCVRVIFADRLITRCVSTSVAFNSRNIRTP